MAIRIGITGSGGFIGGNLVRAFKNKGYPVNYFDLPGGNLLNPNRISLKKFIKNSDIIIHAAAVNRGTDTEVIVGSIVTTYNLIKGIGETKSNAKIIFFSSTQAELDNVYGRSKRLTEILLEDFNRKNNSSVTIFRLPNVFGEGGRPFYNSVAHTFCYQIANNQRPVILIDKKTSFVYIGDLIKIIEKEITVRKKKTFNFKTIESDKIMVSDLLKLIHSFKKIKNFSELKSKFHRNLYKTYLAIKDYEPKTGNKNRRKGKLDRDI